MHIVACQVLSVSKFALGLARIPVDGRRPSRKNRAVGVKKFLHSSRKQTIYRDFHNQRPFRLARSGHMVFIHATGVRIP